MHRLFACLREEEGATAIEYGLIAGLIAVVIITALTFLGPEVAATFNSIGTELQAVNGTGTT